MTFQRRPMTDRNWMREAVFLMRRVVAAAVGVLALAGPGCATGGDLSGWGFEIPGLLGSPVDLGNGTWFLGAGVAPNQLRINRPANVGAADTTNADRLRSGGGLGLNLTGAGVTVGVWDGGAVRSTHQEFGARVTVVDAVGNSDHATHVAGTIGASGVVASARGMATSVSIRSRDWNSDTAEMNADASLIQVSNHSYSYLTGWGPYNWGAGYEDTWFEDRSVYSVEATDFGKYTSVTRDLDTVLYNNRRLLSVWAASNDRDDSYQNYHGDSTYVTYLSGVPNPGWYRVNTASYPAPPGDGNSGTGYDSLPTMQVAKNNLVVGAINDVTADPYNAGHISMTSFSSWGPVDDGRVKADVVANGAGLYSSVATSDSAYASYSGTSMASPNVVGSAALLVEHYRNLHSNVDPLSATLKGAVIHTAFDSGNLGPDYSYGWGLMDAAAAATFLTDAAGADPTDGIFEITYGGVEWTLDFSSDGTSAFRVTLVWTDPATSTLPGGDLDDATAVLVNDLDIWITGPGGTTYRPWTLDPSNPGNAAVRTSANHRDNVEQVFFEAPAVGIYRVHVGNTGGVTSQDFSLLVSGFVPVPEPGALALVFAGGMLMVLRRGRRVATGHTHRSAGFQPAVSPTSSRWD